MLITMAKFGMSFEIKPHRTFYSSLDLPGILQPTSESFEVPAKLSEELLTVLKFSGLRAASIYQSALQEFMKPCSLQNLIA